MFGSPNRCAGISKSVVYLTAVAAVSVRIKRKAANMKPRSVLAK